MMIMMMVVVPRIGQLQRDVDVGGVDDDCDDMDVDRMDAFAGAVMMVFGMGDQCHRDGGNDNDDDDDDGNCVMVVVMTVVVTAMVVVSSRFHRWTRSS